MMGTKLPNVAANLLVLAIAAFVAACESNRCQDDPACEGGVILTIKAPRWESGLYALDIGDSGRSFSCSFELRESSGSSGGQAGQSAVTAGTTRDMFNVNCEQTSGAPAKSWDVPQADFAEGLYVRVQGTPSELELTLDFSGNRLLDERLEPSYAKSYPNGYECDRDNPCLTARAGYDIVVASQGAD